MIKPKYREITISKLIKEYKIPDFQRTIDDDNLKSIYNGIKAQYTEFKDIFIPGMISVGKSDDSLIVFDGQHRLQAMQLLMKEFPIGDIIVRVDEYPVKNEAQIYKLYEIINNNKKVELYRSIDVASCSSRFSKWFKLQFPNHWKETDNPVMLNISGPKVIKMLDACGLLSHPNLFDEILKLNDFYSHSDMSKLGIEINEKKKELLDESNFYLGLFRRYEWIGRLFKDYDEVDHSKLELLQKKNKIPKKKSNEVWNKRFNGITIGSCFTCNEEVDFQKGFHCGHVISRYQGGSNDLSNLEVVCSVCNLNMGTMNMMDYKKMFQN